MNRLFETFYINGLKIKNRIAVPPMVIYPWNNEDGYVSEENIKHYDAIARGGAGLIIQEASCVNKHGKLGKTQIGIWEDGQIEGLKKITTAVHKYGTPILIQIHHAGVVGYEEDVVCPSAYKCVINDTEKNGRELTIEEIHSLQRDYILAAKRAYKAGYDGVEIHACHSYLISQFLNNRVNKRLDIYGQQPELFAQEIIKGIREQTPTEFIVGIRLGGFEPTLEDGIKHAVTLQASGLDFFDISYGFIPEMSITVPQDYPFKDIIYAAEEIKKAVDIPVFAVNGINSPKLAEDILDKTGVDMVAIARGTLVNYNWTNDARAGKDTGTCLNCKTCMWRIDPSKCPGKIKFKKTI